MSWRLARFTGLLLVCLIALSWTASAVAHEVRPAFFQITERADGRYDVLWKQPSQGNLAVRLVPRISGGVLEKPPSQVESAVSFQIQIWRDLDLGPSGLDGRTLEVEGLAQTITDVLVSVSLADGTDIQKVLRPSAPTVALHLGRTGVAVPAYLTLGVEHILIGIDHLFFVLMLVLLVRRGAMLIKTITAFTVAHSITLAATTLDLIAVHPATIEALVALSIVFVAVELVHHYRGRDGLTTRYPWVIAFTFGLLHGSAFAGALSEIGLPPNAIPLSLLLFNVGVEIGQLLFVALILGFIWLMARLPRPLPVWSRWLAPYAVGIAGAFWFFERLEAALI